MANSRFPKFGYGRSAVFAKGRMKAGMLNKTEQNYKEYLEQERQCGRVIAYWFEAIKLKIAEGTCWYNPDFLGFASKWRFGASRSQRLSTPVC